jgi:hypothetical protein
MVDLIELPIDPMEVAEATPFLTQYFPNIFAEALVPLNPRRWQARCQNLAINYRHHLAI